MDQTLFRPGEGAQSDHARLATLRNADGVRARCRLVHRYVADGRSAHFVLDESRIPEAAAYVADVTRDAYPDLAIPLHSRWRHFSAGGIGRWEPLTRRLDANATERARAAVDLAAVSVLLDAGAGAAWRYREPASGNVYSRSEGLAIATIDMFAAGAFSPDPKRPLRATASALQQIDSAALGRSLQAGPDNPLVGLERRADLLRRLGHALKARPDLFGPDGRPGHLVDRFLRTAPGGRVPAAVLLETLLDALSAIWPSGLVVEGVCIGDAGRHLAVRTDDITNGIVPFHKLSQWLAYSLIEPLGMAGLTVVDLDRLTALAEYRNGGLLIDLGVIRPRMPIAGPQPAQSELVVEWRALTVSLMDDLLDPVRRQLGLGADFSLPHLLQGGTWSAGRKIARELRPPDGPPPFVIEDDGTVF